MHRSVPGDTHVGEARRAPLHYNKWRYHRRNLLPTFRQRPVMVGKSPSHTGTSSVLTVNGGIVTQSHIEVRFAQEGTSADNFPGAARARRTADLVLSPPSEFSFRKLKRAPCGTLECPLHPTLVVPYRSVRSRRGTALARPLARSLARERSRRPSVCSSSRPSRRRFRSENRSSAGSLDNAK